MQGDGAITVAEGSTPVSTHITTPYCIKGDGAVTVAGCSTPVNSHTCMQWFGAVTGLSRRGSTPVSSRSY